MKKILFIIIGVYLAGVAIAALKHYRAQQTPAAILSEGVWLWPWAIVTSFR